MAKIRMLAPVVFVLLSLSALIEAKQGQGHKGCPPFTLEACATDKPKLCINSSTCEFGQKCCQVDCNGMQCMSLGSKPGECPFVVQKFLCAINSTQNSPFVCSSDYDCPGNQKCCPQPCVKPICKPPVKPGNCPITTQGCPYYQPIYNECSEDFNCRGSLKCCSTGCGLRCLVPSGGRVRRDYTPPPPPATDAPPDGHGQCPAEDPDYPCDPVVPRSDQCGEYDSCPYGQICCPQCYGKRCLAVDYLASDYTTSCPYFDPNRVCFVQNPTECKPGTTCPDGSLCCEYECGGSRCQPELCPSYPQVECITIGPQMCNATDQCGDNAICCNTVCGGRKCIPLGDEYPQCPKPDPNLKCTGALKRRACHSDTQCKNKKCCDTKCNVKICQTPVRPGCCPSTEGVRCRAPTEAEKKNQCRTDMSCPKRQKCCQICPGWGRICVDPVF